MSAHNKITKYSLTLFSLAVMTFALIWFASSLFKKDEIAATVQESVQSISIEHDAENSNPVELSTINNSNNSVSQNSQSSQTTDNTPNGNNSNGPPGNSPAENRNQATSNVRPGEVLSEEVFRVISEVQRRFEEGQFEEGANELNALYERFDELSSFEQLTVLNFYTNLLLANGMSTEAIVVFEQIIAVEDVRPDIRLRALRALGQLNASESEYERAVEYYTDWLAESEERDSVVLLGLANSHYQLNQYSEAIAPLIEHIDILYTQGEEVERSMLGLLNVLAIETNDYESAAWVTEIMIEQYNQVSDWKNLEAIYEQTGNDVKRSQVINDAKAAGFMDASGNWLDNN